MVWPPPGFEEEARRAEAKLRKLISRERKRAQNTVEGLSEVGLETVDSGELEQEPAEPGQQEQYDLEPPAKSQPLSQTDMDEEIQEIKEMIELAAGEGFMKFADDETEPSSQFSCPPAIPSEPCSSRLPSPVYKDIAIQGMPREPEHPQSEPEDSPEHRGQD
jgi:hypothetical protein